MTHPAHTPPPDRPEWDVLAGLFRAAADIIEDDNQSLTEHLLRETAICECQAWELPEPHATDWLTAEARYQIACTVAIRPRHHDDPLIAAVIEILAAHPPQVQARILRATAQRLAPPHPAHDTKDTQP